MFIRSIISLDRRNGPATFQRLPEATGVLPPPAILLHHLSPSPPPSTPSIGVSSYENPRFLIRRKTFEHGSCKPSSSTGRHKGYGGDGAGDGGDEEPPTLGRVSSGSRSSSLYLSCLGAGESVQVQRVVLLFSVAVVSCLLPLLFLLDTISVLLDTISVLLFPCCRLSLLWFCPTTVGVAFVARFVNTLISSLPSLFSLFFLTPFVRQSPSDEQDAQAGPEPMSTSMASPLPLALKHFDTPSASGTSGGGNQGSEAGRAYDERGSTTYRNLQPECWRLSMTARLPLGRWRTVCRMLLNVFVILS